MERSSLETPDVSLDPIDRFRFVIVAVLVAFVVLRVVPDVMRAYYPLSVFGYETDAGGVVSWVSPLRPASTGKTHYIADVLARGDRVLVDRIPQFDRKPGLVGTAYSRDNPARTLPVSRNGRERTLHLRSRQESVTARVVAIVRILVFLVSLALAALLFLLRPSVATGAIFFYCLGADAPTTWAEIALDNPWQQAPIWLADILHGAGRPALLAFALALLTDDERALRRIALVLAVVALGLGNLNAYADWLATYAGRPQPLLWDTYVHASSVVTGLAVAAFVYAIVRAQASQRARIGTIAAAFGLAGLARVVADAAYPTHVVPWQYGLLLSATVLPIGTVWFSAIRRNYFAVDFVVGRAIVYVAVTAAVVGAFTFAEEVGTYVFYQNTDITYGFLIVISTLIGMGTGKIREAIEHFVDGIVFRDRHDRGAALGLISGYLLDAEHADDVYRALLEDVPHALSLTFAGVMARDAAGDYELQREREWPGDVARRLSASSETVRTILTTRATFEFEGKKRSKARKAAGEPNHFSLAAPLFADRTLAAIVVYGRNISNLNLDSDERERLARLIAYASLALATIELNETRAGLVSDALIPVEPGVPKRIGD